MKPAFFTYQEPRMAISVDHDYGGIDNLRYAQANGAGIGDATVTAYLSVAASYGEQDPVATATTEDDGRWASPMSLEPDTYTLVFRSADFGPDTVQIIVQDPSAPDYEGPATTFDECDGVCGTECVQVFQRVRVRPQIAGGSRIEWELHPNFSDPGPHLYQLQVGRTGIADADDWEDVGFLAVDAYFLTDDEQRAFGKTQWTHYRIVLTSLAATYYSDPVPCLGDLPFRDWRVARAILRSRAVGFRRAANVGYLLKRRIAGEKCEDCRDFQTDEVVNAQCESCYGTGWLDGYFEAVECIWAALDPKVRHEELKGDRATTNDIVVKAEMLAEPQLNEEDVWVDKKSDLRWFVHSIQHLVEYRGFPLVYAVELRLAEFSNPIYQLAIPDQVPS